MRSRSISVSERGPLRVINADACLADDGCGFYAVADGVGSTHASARASAFAVETAHRRYVSDAAGADPERVDLGALAEAVYEDFAAEFGASGRGPSTTLTLLALTARGVRYTSIGDSPIFVVDPGQVLLVTREHTVVDRGRVFSDFTAMKSQPGSNILANAMGLRRPHPIRYPDLEPAAGARLIMCTDGLMELYTQAELVQLAAPEVDLGAVADCILDRARLRDPPDNYTALVIELAHGRSNA